MLTTTLLATRAPVMVAPAMNVHMYTHPAVMHNMDILRSRGVQFIEPEEGLLACGYTGKGRLAEPEHIVEHVKLWLADSGGQSALLPADQESIRSGLLQGKRVLVTAGGTVERIDPVRYITNDSSGKMGFAVAEAARDMGAYVTLIVGQTQVPPPEGIKLIRVE
jgi:phosphopantothenoylcysteine decarboxylase/phosphopantothenate--cysteine ligase